jgi:hypothetical protein
MKRLLLISVLFEVSVLVAGCGGSTSDDPPQPDATADTSSDVPLADASPDAPADGPHVRMLIDVPFLEGSPVDNRFLDPQMSMEAAGTWFEYDPTSTTGVVRVKKRVLTRAPAGQSALYVPGKAENPHGVSIVGGVKLAATAHEGSVWIGTVDTVTISVSVLALDPGAASKSGVYDFAPDLASARDVDGIHWTQYTISLPRGAVGWGFLLVTLKGSGGTYLHAPVMRSTGGTTPRIVGKVGIPRSPTSLELSLARRAFEDGSKIPSSPPRAALPSRE